MNGFPIGSHSWHTLPTAGDRMGAAGLLSSEVAAGTPLTADVEPSARGLGVEGHAERIVGLLLADDPLAPGRT